MSTPTPVEAAPPSAPPRHSKNPAGPVLTLGPATFTTFVNWTTTAVTHNR
ncbi:DUF397 domain-containing protein [Streptomyces sp. NBC_00258]|nr:DUF397 domain-containing protein [Streptomyces sp. NBC_00258]